jgi:hypothetical protein
MFPNIAKFYSVAILDAGSIVALCKQDRPAGGAAGLMRRLTKSLAAV